MDSRSRISPTRRTSGSSRRAERSARSKEGLSRPISRWLTAERLCSCTYSTGSSIVRMCSARVSLMRAMMDARVVDLPEPVGPVAARVRGGGGPATRRWAAARVLRSSGSPRGSSGAPAPARPSGGRRCHAVGPCPARSVRSRRPGAPRGWPPARDSTCRGRARRSRRPSAPAALSSGRRPPSTLTLGAEPLTRSRSEPW